MGFADKVRGMFGRHGDKAKGAVDKGADVADDKTGGRYTGQIDTGAEAAKDQIDKLGES